MTKNLIKKFAETKSCFLHRMAKLTAVVVLLAAVAGCQTEEFPAADANKQMTNSTAATEAITLREGDILKISFPGSPNLDTTQPIRRDGKISLQLVGEVQAAGMTPSELESHLIN